jgi:outer membrane lipoprotein-sorting protein
MTARRMVSDGKNFTLYIPSQSKAVKGPTELKKKSPNRLENMRPGFFFDAMVVHGLSSGDEYYVTNDTDTMEDAAKKHLYLMPEYLLNIVRRMPGSQELAPARVVHFHRDDLLPYQQDLYDAEGNLQTQITYGQYVAFGLIRYPSTITIKRPLDGLKLVLTVEKVAENTALTDEEFHFTLPPDTTIKKLP